VGAVDTTAATIRSSTRRSPRSGDRGESAETSHLAIAKRAATEREANQREDPPCERCATESPGHARAESAASTSADTTGCERIRMDGREFEKLNCESTGQIAGNQ